MTEQDSTTERTPNSEWLASLFSQTFWPLDAFIKTIGEYDANEDLLAVLIPLVDRAKSDLEVLEDVLAQSFGGHIKIEITECKENYRAFEQSFFGKVWVDSPLASGPLDSPEDLKLMEAKH